MNKNGAAKDDVPTWRRKQAQTGGGWKMKDKDEDRDTREQRICTSNTTALMYSRKTINFLVKECCQISFSEFNNRRETNIPLVITQSLVLHVLREVDHQTTSKTFSISYRDHAVGNKTWATKKQAD